MASSAPTRSSQRSRLYYGWIVVAVTFIAGLLVAGIRSSPAVFITPFEAEFGWDRAAVAGAVSVNLVLFGLAAPISGRLIDRYGPRIVILGILGLLAVGVCGTIFMSSLWQLYLLWGVVVGLAAGGGGSVLSATVASRWFVSHRGLVVGILSGANSTGQLIFIPIMMATTVAAGWRTGSTLLVVCCLAMLIPVFFLMRNDPSEKGLEPLGTAPAIPTAGSVATADKPAAPAQTKPVPFKEFLRAPEFWLLATSFFMCGSTANGLIGTHLIPNSHDHGIPDVAAATAVGVMGGMNLVGTLASGYFTDKVNPRWLLAGFFVFRGVSLFILPFVADFSGLMIFAVIYGLDWFATVPPTIAITAQRFGRNSVGSVYGWIYFAHQLGAGMAAFGAGAIRVWLGDYQLAFLIGGMMALTGACLALMVRTAPPAAPRPLAPAAAAA